MPTVFLIDDDPVFVYLTQKMISTIDPSIELQTFGDGEMAMDRLNAIRESEQAFPDIILLDLNMPVMDGWEFLDYYSSLSPSIRGTTLLYIVSSTISPEDITRAGQNTAVSEVIIKPVEKKQLARILLNS